MVSISRFAGSEYFTNTVDTKIPIKSIRPKKANASFTSIRTDDEVGAIRTVPAGVRVNEEQGEFSISAEMDEEQGDTPSPVDGGADEQNEVNTETSRSSREVAVAGGANDALPVATKVEPPAELLERIRSLEEAENRIPSATPVDEEERQKMDRQQAREKRRWILVGSAGVLLAVLAMLLGVTLGGRNKPSTPPNSVTPGLPPTPAPTTEARIALQDLIASHALDGGVALSDPLSPQFKALSWLESDANLDYPDWRKVQRHVLATFYYSTNGDDWLERDGWLMEEHECDWFSSAVDPPCDENGVFTRLVLFDNNVTGSLPKDIAILSDSMRECHNITLLLFEMLCLTTLNAHILFGRCCLKLRLLFETQKFLVAYRRRLVYFRT